MEDPYYWAILGRTIERIVTVGFGGLSVYFGFRLFLLLPVQQSSSGKIELPGMSVVLSKAGPGIFFVAFGALILLSTFFNPVSIQTGDDREDKLASVGSYVGLGGALPVLDDVSDQDIARARSAIQILNCMAQGYVQHDLPVNRDVLLISVNDAKLALLQRVWNRPQWGDFNSFLEQLKSGELDTGSPAMTLYLADLPGCHTTGQ